MGESRYATDRPTVEQIVPLIEAIYRTRGGLAGCCLHLVFDDGNYGRDSVAYCLEIAREYKHERCIKLAELCLEMSRTQLAKASRKASRQ
jgi:hypothetical protein